MITPPTNERSRHVWTALLLISGAVCLGYEVIWIRRLGLLLGGTAPASAFAIGAFMAGLAVGGPLSSLIGKRMRISGAYAFLESVAAVWALGFPVLLAAGIEIMGTATSLKWILAAALLIPPAAALGATWPLLASRVGVAMGTRLYAANTAGAVVGVLGMTFVGLPTLGVRGAEISVALLGLGLAATAVFTAPRVPVRPAQNRRPNAPAWPILAASAAAGFSALGLEVVWMRLAAVAWGATVQTIGLVLAVFLATVAAGAWLGRTFPADPRTGLAQALGAMGALALLGAAGWGQLPFAIAWLYALGGPEAMMPGTLILAIVGMGGAPVASGVAFSCAVRALPDLETQAAPLYSANTLGCIAGSVLGGLWAIPTLEIAGSAIAFALVAAASGAWVLGSVRPLLPTVILAVVLPSWDARLYALGVHLRISDFADPSRASIEAFVDEGWELLAYDHGPTGAVAVGRSITTGNVWLSINGKVDASTGDDMPTQILSGTLPVRMTPEPSDVLLVGLASGITAGAVLAEPNVERLTILEIEPVVERASHYFDHLNGTPLLDPRTSLHITDARTWLQDPGPPYDTIISEPSNPWITGVSSLFTLEYWQASRRRLKPGGAMCQWVQLYGMGPEEFRGIVRTFQSVFPEVWLFETIAGSDILLIGGTSDLPVGLPLSPTLDPAGVRRLAGDGWLNTDDHPRVEWNAPGWLHYDSAPGNAQLIHAASIYEVPP
jgi:spermidine synthase